MYFPSELFIGFQQTQYEFPETDEIQEAVIIKVNGTITEQTYLIVVSASGDSALSGCDYNVTGDGDTKRFIIDPDQQSVEFRFEILEDSIVEYVESFSISLENAPENEPRFETQGANTTTRIDIMDRTCEIMSNFTCVNISFL